MQKKKIIGIYKIECTSNRKVYIGQSVDIEKRLYKHKITLQNNSHDNKHLQSSWNKYGEENFTFNILEECKKEELDDKEIFYIEKYNSANENFGFNKTLGGKSFIAYVKKDNKIISINDDCFQPKTKNRKKKNVLQFDLDGNLIKVWHGVNSIFKENEDWCETPLRKCLRMEKSCYTYKNSFWFYEDSYTQELLHKLINNKFLDGYELKKQKDSEFLTQLNKSRAKKFNQYDLNHIFVRQWDSQLELEKNGFSRMTLRKRIKEGKPYNGFYFEEIS